MRPEGGVLDTPALDYSALKNIYNMNIGTLMFLQVIMN